MPNYTKWDTNGIIGYIITSSLLIYFKFTKYPFVSLYNVIFTIYNHRACSTTKHIMMSKFILMCIHIKQKDFKLGYAINTSLFLFFFTKKLLYCRKFGFQAIQSNLCKRPHLNKGHQSTKTTSDSSHQKILHKLPVNRDHLRPETRGQSKTEQNTSVLFCRTDPLNKDHLWITTSFPSFHGW